MWTQILAAFNGLPPAASSALTALASSLLTVLLGAIVLWRTNAGHDRRLKAQLAAAADLERVKRDAAAVEHKERLDAAAALEDKKLAAAAKDSERKLAAAAEETERKLQHAADEAHKQRLQTMRREVFTEAITALAKARVQLSSMASIDIAQNPPAAMVTEFAVAIDRLSLVASNESLEKIRRFGLVHAQVLMSALPLLGKMATARGAARLHGEYREEARSELRRAMAEMTTLRERGEGGSALMSNLARTCELSQQKQAECWESEKLSLDEVNKLTAQISKHILSAYSEVVSSTDSVVLALRAELGIGTDEAAFRALSSSMRQTMADQAKAVLPNVFGGEVQEASAAVASHTIPAQVKPS